MLRSARSLSPVLLAALSALLSTTPLASQEGEKPKPGYTDTPIIPGQKWRVHDPERPYPPVVDPGPATGPAPVPADAVVLFGGAAEHLARWRSGNGDARWEVVDGAMQVNGTGDIHSKETFGDCQLHVEWATPAEVRGESQGRGNSGVFFFGRYEVQVLDSHGNATYPDGQAAALYGQFPPDFNACRAPGEWQTYDIIFRAPRFNDDGSLQSPAIVTVFHNGILVHDHRAMLGPSGHRSVPKYSRHAAEGPIKLQDHGNPVRFRSIWARRL
ncbi:MAG: family 16 glycoside hydrolase [Planctomycetota bacterium]